MGIEIAGTIIISLAKSGVQSTVHVLLQQCIFTVRVQKQGSEFLGGMCGVGSEGICCHQHPFCVFIPSQMRRIRTRRSTAAALLLLRTTWPLQSPAKEECTVSMETTLDFVDRPPVKTVVVVQHRRRRHIQVIAAAAHVCTKEVLVPGKRSAE